MNSFHTSVLLKETIELLQIKKNHRYIDATLGGGGHSFEILKRGGKVLGIDWDEEALDYVKEKWEEVRREFGIDKENLTLARGNFKEIDRIAHLNGFNKVSGVIFDLGISSHQLNNAERGFSFSKQGPLDMRMDNSLSVKASDLVNILTKGELYEIFSKLGQEHRARAISNSIARTRRINAFQTTGDLARVVEEAYGITGAVSAFTKAKVNKRVFQALRIAVNRELENIREALPKAEKLLEKKGRMSVITFHSLEDEIVKKTFIDFQKKEIGRIITKKPIVPGLEEIKLNRRSKSAKLRIFEKN